MNNDTCAAANELKKWYIRSKRDLPWRNTGDPYAIWVSEIMLQQTRAETVIPYWNRFIQLFPTVYALAEAPEQDVLKAWEGLGYYSRARNLRLCAKAVVQHHDGIFPRDPAALQALPGIGAYTAGAVASIAFSIPIPAVDGNVERVISRLMGIRENISVPSVHRMLRERAASLVPSDEPGIYNQAVMELGARICQPAPRCPQCPIASYCDAYEAGDADALPIKQRKTPQRTIPRGIALVIFQKKALLHKREERLLQGLWCFPGFDDCFSAGRVEEQLKKLEIDAHYWEVAGHARHVFTHLIWDMTFFCFQANSPKCPEGWRWADQDALNQLPLPGAMTAAKKVVEGIIGKDGKEAL